MVILDTKDEVCFIDTSEIEELSSYTIKKPLVPFSGKYNFTFIVIFVHLNSK